MKNLKDTNHKTEYEKHRTIDFTPSDFLPLNLANYSIKRKSLLTGTIKPGLIIEVIYIIMTQTGVGLTEITNIQICKVTPKINPEKTENEDGRERSGKNWATSSYCFSTIHSNVCTRQTKGENELPCHQQQNTGKS